MRSLVLSLGAISLVIGVAWAQAPAGGGNVPQIPYGQTFKDFQFPLYQDGQLKATLAAISAKGVTINRAETTELKIELYDQGKVTTTITSPKADLYLAERQMRTKNTVLIERADMEATAQTCDFDLTNKKYLLRENVRVILKNFDASFKPSSAASSPSVPSKGPAPSAGGNAAATPSPAVLAPHPARNDSMLDTPGAYANTNMTPAPPPPPSTVTP
jgi:hypothetical protein